MNSNIDSTLSASTVIRDTRSLSVGLVINFFVTLGLSLYFSAGLATLRPPHYLPLSLLALGLLLSIVFLPLSANRDPESVSLGKNKALFLVFQLIQGGLGFALAHYIFNLDWKAALAFPIGAAISLFIFLLLCCEQRRSMALIIVAAFGAAGLTLALRLQGLWGGLLFGLALLQSAWIGLRLLAQRDAQLLWVQSLFFITLLVIGRAAIQYYLLMSNYANLGVVISQPYTFVALAAGVLLPIVCYKIENESLLAVPFVFLLALLIPLALGLMVHVRPMAAYLMGVTLSTFALGTLGWGTLRLGLIALLNLALISFALPIFQKANSWERILRLEILGGAALLVFVLLLLGAKMNKASSE